MEANAELGRGDGGVAWAVTLINACNWMAAGLFPRDVSDEVFSKPNTRVAGVFANRGVVARRVPGGMIVEKGMWFFNSGVFHADWDILGVPILNDAGEVVDRGAAIVPMSDVNILNDWDTFGLRGSGSSNVSMENVFIPDKRIVSIAACTKGTQASGFHDLPYFRTAFAPLMVSILSFPVLGMGMAALESLMEPCPSATSNSRRTQSKGRQLSRTYRSRRPAQRFMLRNFLLQRLAAIWMRGPMPRNTCR